MCGSGGSPLPPVLSQTYRDRFEWSVTGWSAAEKINKFMKCLNLPPSPSSKSCLAPLNYEGAFYSYNRKHIGTHNARFL